jgi:hypothetical protein
MSWIITLCIVVVLSVIEIYKFFTNHQRFRLLIIIPLILYIIVGSPLAKLIPNTTDIFLRVCGIVFIVVYFGLISRIKKLRGH